MKMHTSYLLFFSSLFVFFVARSLQKPINMATTPGELRCVMNTSNGEMRMEPTQPEDRAAAIHNSRCCTFWPEGKIYYKNVNIRSNKWRDAVSSMNLWETTTCVKFIKADANYKGNVLYIKRPRKYSLCSSPIGYRPYGNMNMFLGNGCFNRGARTIKHEFGHAIGLIHEQKRKDRDKYIEVQYNNIMSKKKNQFSKDYASTTFGSPYDYCSIMHYNPYLFSTGFNKIAIKTKDLEYQNVIGYQNGISFHDMKTVNTMYKCASHCSRNLKCSSGSCFLNKDCKCVCPRKRRSGQCDVYGFNQSPRVTDPVFTQSSKVTHPGFTQPPKVTNPDVSTESAVETITAAGFSKTNMDKYCSRIVEGSKSMITHTCQYVTCVKNGRRTNAHVINYNICPSYEFCHSGKCSSATMKRPKGALTLEQWKVANQQCQKELGQGYEPYCSIMNIGTHPNIASSCTNNLCDAVLCAEWQGRGLKLSWAYLSEGSSCGNGKICRRKRCQ